MANFGSSKSRFGYPLVVDDQDGHFDDFDVDLPFSRDQMIDPSTRMRRKTWSDDGFVD